MSWHPTRGQSHGQEMEAIQSQEQANVQFQQNARQPAWFFQALTNDYRLDGTFG